MCRFYAMKFSYPSYIYCACMFFSHQPFQCVKYSMKLLHVWGYTEVLPFLLLPEADINFKLYKE